MSKLLHSILDEENLNMHVPLLERGPSMLILELRSRDLRAGRALKNLKISLSKEFEPKFKCVSLPNLDKQLDSGKKK